MVVTIVVLLILAGVTISLLLDENGIIQKSKDARREYKQAQTNEQSDFDNISDLIDEATGVMDWNKILEKVNADPEKYKHPDQSSTNQDIGIGTDGKPVNLDLWTYMVINENEINLSGNAYSQSVPGYQNANITEDGEIQGKVPQYIKIAGTTEFYPVTSIGGTFAYCVNLKIAPEIPSSVTNMHSTFYGCTSLITAPTIPSSVTGIILAFSGCTSLTTAPEIPSSVTGISSAFSGCTSLTTAPEIPSSVTNMRSTFSGCTSLTTAPTIPSSVTNMDSTFYRCTSLTGNLVINANPTDYEYCLENVATATGTNLVVSGTSTLLNEIIATKSNNSNITKGN